jgi:hypothetical protein
METAIWGQAPIEKTLNAAPQGGGKTDKFA